MTYNRPTKHKKIQKIKTNIEPGCTIQNQVRRNISNPSDN